MDSIKNYAKKTKDVIKDFRLPAFGDIIRNKSFVKTPYPTDWCEGGQKPYAQELKGG